MKAGFSPAVNKFQTGILHFTNKLVSELLTTSIVRILSGRSNWFPA
jgi:hypothetical protein